MRDYGWRWRRARDAYVRAHPLCVACLATGRAVAARVVDHVVPHEGDDALLWAERNWQSLCHACHNAKTTRQAREGLDEREQALQRALGALPPEG